MICTCTRWNIEESNFYGLKPNISIFTSITFPAIIHLIILNAREHNIKHQNVAGQSMTDIRCVACLLFCHKHVSVFGMRLIVIHFSTIVIHLLLCMNEGERESDTLNIAIY